MSNIVTECYQTMTNPFGALGPFYDNLGHRGADYRRTARQSVVAFESGVIEVIDQLGGIGRVVGMRTDSGEFVGWAHLYNIQVKVGQRVKAGDVIAYVAGAGDQPGDLWDGAHIHTTRSRISSRFAASGIRPLIDPVPAINRAKLGSATAGGGGSTIEEDNMKYTRFQNDTDFLVKRSQQFFPAVTTPRSENFAAGTGGLGLYELTTMLQLKNFPADAKVFAQFVLTDSKTGKASNGYVFSFAGNASKVDNPSFTTHVDITAAGVLRLRLWSEGGPKEPTLTLFGVDVKNFQ